ncbi:MAG: ribosome-associated translation inhibitor RaiA [Frankia sp.]|nr:ribosome-associated translation inhibitor RaiA [Frankia sp.]
MDIVVRGRNTAVPERFRNHVQTKLAKLEKFDGKAMRVDVELSRESNPRLSDVRDRVELTVYSRGPLIRAEAAAADPYAALDGASGKLFERMRRVAERRADRLHGNHTRAYTGSPTGRGGPRAAAAAVVASSVTGLPAPGSGDRVTLDESLERVRASSGAVPGRPTVAAAAAGRAFPADESPGDEANTVGTGPMALGARIRPDTRDIADELEADRYEQPYRSPMVVRRKVHRAAPMTLEEALSNMELVGHDFYLFQDVGSGRPSVVYRRRGYDYGVIHLIGPDDPEPASGEQPAAESGRQAEPVAMASGRRAATG